MNKNLLRSFKDSSYVYSNYPQVKLLKIQTTCLMKSIFSITNRYLVRPFNYSRCLKYLQDPSNIFVKLIFVMSKSFLRSFEYSRYLKRSQSSTSTLHVTRSLSSSCILPWSTARFQRTLHMDQQTIVKMSPIKGEYQRGSFDKSFRSDTIHCIFFFFVVSILIRPQSSVRGTLWENLRLEPGPRAYESARISRRCPIFLRLFCPRFHRNLQNRMAVVRINDTAEVVFLLLLVRLLLQLVEHRGLLTVVHHDDNTILNNWRLGKRRLNLRRIRCTTRSTMGLEDFDRHCPLKQKEIRLWKKERMG